MRRRDEYLTWGIIGAGLILMLYSRMVRAKALKNGMGASLPKGWKVRLNPGMAAGMISDVFELPPGLSKMAHVATEKVFEHLEGRVNR